MKFIEVQNSKSSRLQQLTEYYSEVYAGFDIWEIPNYVMNNKAQTSIHKLSDRQGVKATV